MEVERARGVIASETAKREASESKLTAQLEKTERELHAAKQQLVSTATRADMTASMKVMYLMVLH